MTAQSPTHDTLDERTTTAPDAAAEHGRRALLRKVALGSAGAAAAALALDRTAQAADGDNVILGQPNAATSPTTIAVTPAAPVTAGPSALSVGAAAPAPAAPFPASVGGYGDGGYANGVHGSTIAAVGHGVVAANLAAAAGSASDPAPAAALAVASVGGAHVHFVKLAGAVAGPTPGVHMPGELYCDATGTLWFSVPTPPVAPSTTPGVRWVKLAGPDTAGSFHALPVAKRCYDSRLAPGGAKIAENGTVDIDLTKDTAGAATGFPAGARIALVNLTVTGTELRGFVQLYATGTPVAQVQTSNINWFEDGASIANSSGVPVNAAGSITARVGSDATDGATARTHIVVDLIGYYQ
jgi:hypothetical protein